MKENKEKEKLIGSTKPKNYSTSPASLSNVKAKDSFVKTLSKVDLPTPVKVSLVFPLALPFVAAGYIGAGMSKKNYEFEEIPEDTNTSNLTR